MKKKSLFTSRDIVDILGYSILHTAFIIFLGAFVVGMLALSAGLLTPGITP